MPRHTLPAANWHMALANAIEAAQDDDTIVCHSEAMAELAEEARQRLCPSKRLVFEVEAPDPFAAPPPPLSFPTPPAVLDKIFAEDKLPPDVLLPGGRGNLRFDATLPTTIRSFNDFETWLQQFNEETQEMFRNFRFDL